MKLKANLIVLIGAFSGAAIAASYVATAPASYEGLVPVQSRNLDKLYVRPNAELARYQKVMIDPVTVEFSKEWDRNVNDPRYTTRVRHRRWQEARDREPHRGGDDRQRGRHPG